MKSFAIDIQEEVYSASFAPYEWCSSLLAVGTSSKIKIFNIKLVTQEEDTDFEKLEFEEIKVLQVGCYVNSVAWSPQTLICNEELQKKLKFAAAAADRLLRIFESDLKNVNTDIICSGHKDYINSIAFEPTTGDVLASVSDDLSCRVWSADGTQLSIFYLESPGMSVSWHKDEYGQLMVAEKKGIIRFYDVENEIPFMSLNCNSTPLMSAQWCPADSSKVGSVAGQEWQLWDVAAPSKPLQGMAYHEGDIALTFSSSNDYFFACRNRRGNQIKIIIPKTKQAFSVAENLSGYGLTWHFNLPFLVAGGGRKIYLFKINKWDLWKPTNV